MSFLDFWYRRNTARLDKLEAWAQNIDQLVATCFKTTNDRLATLESVVTVQGHRLSKVEDDLKIKGQGISSLIDQCQEVQRWAEELTEFLKRKHKTNPPYIQRNQSDGGDKTTAR